MSTPKTFVRGLRFDRGTGFLLFGNVTIDRTYDPSMGPVISRQSWDTFCDNVDEKLVDSVKNVKSWERLMLCFTASMVILAIFGAIFPYNVAILAVAIILNIMDGSLVFVFFMMWMGFWSRWWGGEPAKFISSAIQKLRLDCGFMAVSVKGEKGVNRREPWRLVITVAPDVSSVLPCYSKKPAEALPL